jgi:hypothetical protein
MRRKTNHRDAENTEQKFSKTLSLLGYELVEGKMDNGRISELRRINYAPL